MGYKSISVDVDVNLDEFDTDDLVEEIISRIKSKDLSDEDIEDLKRELRMSDRKSTKHYTLEDIMKDEVVSEAWNRLTSAQFEERLKR
jgi:hypothetical protein